MVAGVRVLLEGQMVFGVALISVCPSVCRRVRCLYQQRLEYTSTYTIDVLETKMGKIPFVY